MRFVGRLPCLLLVLLLAAPFSFARDKARDPKHDPDAIGTRDVALGSRTRACAAR
jgi:hypothetical protein